MELSVVICSHNPRPDALERTLRGLDAQTLPKTRWELLLVDNASDTALSTLHALDWHPDARHVVESRPGLTPARIAGINAARGNAIVFVDDDNILAPDYLETTLGHLARHPTLGCIGAGIITPEFAVEPEARLQPYLWMLALRTLDRAAWSNLPADGAVPWGAGLVVRRAVAAYHVEKCQADRRLLDLDRKGASLNAGGDDHFSWSACEIGYGRGIFPDLVVTHLIPANRVEESYLLRLREGHSYSHAMLANLLGTPFARPRAPASFGVLIQDACRLRISRVLSDLAQLWRERNLSPTARRFQDADYAGKLRAWRQLAEMQASAELRA